jgi:hypothetical protein
MGRPKKSRGLGDTIEKITTTTGIKKLVEIFVDGKDCGCEQRKEKLNELFPYRFKARCLTEYEYNRWKEFKAIRTLTISREQVNYVCELYASVFNRPIWFPCASCSPKPLISMIDKLDKVYDSYNIE